MNEKIYPTGRLEIPENIPLRWELFRGFGVPELLRSAVIVALVGFAAYFYAQLSTSPFRVITAIFAVIAGAMISAGLFSRQNNNLSMYDYLKYAVQFGHTQKHYDFIKEEEIIYENEKTGNGSAPVGAAVSQY